MRLTVTASIGAKVVSVLCTLAQVPLALHSLGTEAYGVWITLFNVMVMLNLVDFGLGVRMQKSMAQALGEDDYVRMQRVFLSGAAALGLLSLATLLIGLPLALGWDWSEALHIHDATLRAQAGPALALAIGAFALGLPLNASARLAAAAQRGWIHAGWIAVGSAITLGIVAWAAWIRCGFLSFVAVTVLVPTIQGIGLTVHLWRSLEWKWSDAALLPRSEWRGHVHESLSFGVPQLALAVAQSAPPLALMLAAGPVASATFNVLQRLFSPFVQAQIIFLTPLWPAFTEAQVRGDAAWVRRAFNQSLLVTGCAIILVAGMTWQADTLLHWWLGAKAPDSGPVLAWLVAAWTITLLAWQPPLYLLVGTGRPVTLMLWGTVGPALAIAGMFGLSSLGFGAIGTLGGATAGLFLGWPGLMLAARRVLSTLGSRDPR